LPRLDEIRDDLIAALNGYYGALPSTTIGLNDPVLGSNLFARLAWVALNLVATSKVASAAADALDEAGLLIPGALATAHPLELDDVLKQARVAMAIKSLRPLQKLARWAADLGDSFGLEGLASRSTATIRDEWRGINGVGLASTDALLLFGLGRVSYPVDRATYRILVRHGWLDSTADYDEARSAVERFAQVRPALGGNEDGDRSEAAVVERLKHLSGWFERLGRDFCKPTQARCERCPLRAWLPPTGPVEVE